MHWYSGAGDPFDWPIIQFDRAVDHIESIENRKKGEEDTVAKGFSDFLKGK